MQLKKYEVDALVNEISSGKKSSKNLTISNVKLQAFLRRPASGQQAASIQHFNLDDGQEGFADALLQFADAANEIGAKAQVLRQMANDLRKETEACLQAKPAGRKGAKGLQKMLQQPEGCKEAVADAEICTVEGFGDRLKQMKAMQSGDFSHLLADIESSSNPQALQKLPALEDLVITPTPLDEFMDALDKHYSDALGLPVLPFPARDSGITVSDDEAAWHAILDQLEPPVCSIGLTPTGTPDVSAHGAGGTSSAAAEHLVALQDVVAALRLEELHAQLSEVEMWYPYPTRYRGASSHAVGILGTGSVAQQQKVLQSHRDAYSVAGALAQADNARKEPPRVPVLQLPPQVPEATGHQYPRCGAACSAGHAPPVHAVVDELPVSTDDRMQDAAIAPVDDTVRQRATGRMHESGTLEMVDACKDLAGTDHAELNEAAGDCPKSPAPSHAGLGDMHDGSIGFRGACGAAGVQIVGQRAYMHGQLQLVVDEFEVREGAVKRLRLDDGRSALCASTSDVQQELPAACTSAATRHLACGESEVGTPAGSDMHAAHDHVGDGVQGGMQAMHDDGGWGCADGDGGEGGWGGAVGAGWRGEAGAMEATCGGPHCSHQSNVFSHKDAILLSEQACGSSALENNGAEGTRPEPAPAEPQAAPGFVEAAVVLDTDEEDEPVHGALSPGGDADMRASRSHALESDTCAAQAAPVAPRKPLLFRAKANDVHPVHTDSVLEVSQRVDSEDALDSPLRRGGPASRHDGGSRATSKCAGDKAAMEHQTAAAQNQQNQVSTEAPKPLRRPLFLRKLPPAQPAPAPAAPVQHTTGHTIQQPEDSIEDPVDASGGTTHNTCKNDDGNPLLAAFKSRLCKEAAAAETRVHAQGGIAPCSRSISHDDGQGGPLSLVTRTQQEGGDVSHTAVDVRALKPVIERAPHLNPGTRNPAGAVQPLTFRRSANAKEQATEAGTSGSSLMQEGGMFDNPDDGEDFDIRAVSRRQRVQLGDSDDEQAVEAVTGTGTQVEVNELIRQKSIVQILEAGKKAKKQKKMSSEQQAGHVAVGQSVGGACPCIHFDFSHDTIVKYWPDTITRRLAQLRKPIKLVKPSSTVQKTATFTLLPDVPGCSANTHHTSLTAPSSWAAKDIWPQAQVKNGMPRIIQGRADTAPPLVVPLSLYMHGPHANITRSNFHWASYSMATGRPFNALQQHASKLSDAQQAGTASLSTADEEALLNSQIELSIALDARSLAATAQQKVQQVGAPLNPSVPAAGSALPAHQSCTPTANMLRTPEPQYSYFAPPTGQRVGEAMAEPKPVPRFPNAVSVEPHTSSSHSSLHTPFQRAWGILPGQGYATGAAPHTVYVAQQSDVAMSSDDDDALFDACDAALARYASGHQNLQGGTEAAQDGGCASTLHVAPNLPGGSLQASGTASHRPLQQEPSASQDCEIQFCDDHTQHEFSLTMLGQQCENGEQQPNDAALQHDHDLDIEFFTEKDLQHPSQSEAGHAQMSCSSARGGGGATRQSNCPLGRTPVGFEEVDAASLAALLGQEASTMCDIVFCDEDSASPAGAGTAHPGEQQHLQPQIMPIGNSGSHHAQLQTDVTSSSRIPNDALAPFSQMASGGRASKAGGDADQAVPEGHWNDSGDEGCAFELDMDMCCDDGGHADAGAHAVDDWDEGSPQDGVDSDVPIAGSPSLHINHAAQRAHPLHSEAKVQPVQTLPLACGQNSDSKEHQRALDGASTGQKRPLDAPDVSQQICDRGKVRVVLQLSNTGNAGPHSSIVTVCMTVQRDSDHATVVPNHTHCIESTAGDDLQGIVPGTGHAGGVCMHTHMQLEHSVAPPENPSENQHLSRQPQEAPKGAEDMEKASNVRIEADVPVAGACDTPAAACQETAATQNPTTRHFLLPAAPQNPIAWGKPFQVKDLLSSVVRRRADVQSPLASVVECLEEAAESLPVMEPQRVIDVIKRARERKPDIRASPVRVLAWMTTLPYHYSSSASTLTYVMMCRGGLLDAYSWPAASTVKQAQHNPLLAQRCTRSAHAFDL